MKLSLIDCESIYRLLKSGFSIQDTFDLIEDTKNEEILHSISNHLQQGSSLTEAIHPYLPKEILSHTLSFSKFLSFEKSLELSIQLYEKKKDTLNQSIKILVYPLLLLFGTILGLNLFNQLIFPTLMSLLDRFGSQNNLYTIMHQVITLFTILFFVLLVSIGILFFYARDQNHALKLYQRLYKNLHNSIFQKLITIRMIRYFMVCHQMGISTKETMTLLKGLENDRIIQWIALEMDQSFQVGESFQQTLKQPTLDPLLEKFILIATYSSSLDEMMVSYLETSEERVKRELKQFSKRIQFFTYALISFLLIFIYQILLMPLEVLSNF